MTHELTEGLPRRLVRLRHSARLSARVGYLVTYTASFCIHVHFSPLTLYRTGPLLHLCLFSFCWELWYHSA